MTLGKAGWGVRHSIAGKPIWHCKLRCLWQIFKIENFTKNGCYSWNQKPALAARWRQLPLAFLYPTSICCRKSSKLRTTALEVRKRNLCYGFQWCLIWGTLIFTNRDTSRWTPLQGNLKTFNNKKIAAWNFSRKGAKAQRLLIHWLCAFAPLREAFFQTFCTRGFLQKPDCGIHRQVS